MGIIKTNASTITAGTIGLGFGTALGSVAGYAMGKRRKKRKSHSNKRVRSKVRSNRKRRRTGRKTKTHHYKSKKRIHYTKNGQPYVIVAGGKARFIKRKSARISKKRRGGRY